MRAVVDAAVLRLTRVEHFHCRAVANCGAAVVVVVGRCRADIGRADDVLAVLLVVPGVALDALASYAELFGLELDDLEVEGELDAAPVVAHADAQREALALVQQVLAVDHVDELLDDEVSVERVRYGDVARVLGLARRLEAVEALARREYGLNLVEAALDAAEHGRATIRRVDLVQLVVHRLRSAINTFFHIHIQLNDVKSTTSQAA